MNLYDRRGSDFFGGGGVERGEGGGRRRGDRLSTDLVLILNDKSFENPHTHQSVFSFFYFLN